MSVPPHTSSNGVLKSLLQTFELPTTWTVIPAQQYTEYISPEVFNQLIANINIIKGDLAYNDPVSNIFEINTILETIPDSITSAVNQRVLQELVPITNKVTALETATTELNSDIVQESSLRALGDSQLETKIEDLSKQIQYSKIDSMMVIPSIDVKSTYQINGVTYKWELPFPTIFQGKLEDGTTPPTPPTITNLADVVISSFNQTKADRDSLKAELLTEINLRPVPIHITSTEQVDPYYFYENSPVYIKHLIDIPLGNDTTTSFGHGITGFKNAINMYGWAVNSVTGDIISFPNGTNNAGQTESIYIKCDTTNLNMTTNSDLSAYKLNLTIRYLKT